jgi:glutamine synthetase adenylyltransferase
LQALTRARSVSGSLQSEFMKIAKRAWSRVCQDADLFIKIDDMLKRIRRERGSGSDFLDLKTGNGGIIEAEFLVQALQMRGNIWEPKWERAVDRMHEPGHLSSSEIAKLKSSYAFLRRCELVLRRYDNRGGSTLPSAPDEQRKFVIRLGYDEFDAFRRDYLDARDAIHTLYQRHIKPA